MGVVDSGGPSSDHFRSERIQNGRSFSALTGHWDDAGNAAQLFGRNACNPLLQDIERWPIVNVNEVITHNVSLSA